MNNIYLLSIICPLMLGFFSFSIKKLLIIANKNKRLRQAEIIINSLFLISFFILFLSVFFSIFKLNLISGKVYYEVIGGWSRNIGIELKYNLIRALCIMSILLITCVFFATNLFGGVSYAFRGFVCIMVCGANGIIVTNDIFNSYVFFEIVCITNYIIYAHSNNKECVEQTFNYMILSGFVGTIFLLVAGFLYQITGNLNIDIIHSTISQYKNNKSVNAIFVLFVLSMMFKIGVYPVHSILTEIYKNLGANKLLVVAGVSSIAYPIFILKMIVDLFGVNVLVDNEYLHIMLKLCGGVGFLFFNILAFTTKKIKDFIILLAFSQTSFFCFFIPYLIEKNAQTGLVFAIVSHSLLKVCLFALLYKFQNAFNYDDLTKKDIIYLDKKIYKYIIVLLLFLISGMPFSLVFMSKWYIISGFIQTPASIIWLFVVILGFTFDIIACFSFIMRVLSINDTDRVVKINYKEDIVLIISIIFIILFVVLFAFYSDSFSLVKDI